MRPTVSSLSDDVERMEIDIRKIKENLEASDRGTLQSRSDLVSRIVLIENNLKQACERIERTDRALYGNNGTPGIVARISNLEEKMTDIKNAMYTIIVGIAIGLLMQIGSLLAEHGMSFFGG